MAERGATIAEKYQSCLFFTVPEAWEYIVFAEVAFGICNFKPKLLTLQEINEAVGLCDNT